VAAVIAGHFGFAAAVKASERRVPLWALMLACEWLDVVFVPFVVAGVEHIDKVPGTSGGYGEAIIHADYTHSLIGALVLSAIFGAVCAWRWGRRSGVVLGAVVFSHWILDLVVHRGDMPILPGHAGTLGLGLWRYPAIAAAVELALVAIGAYAYWRAARAVSVDAKQPMRRANVAGLVVAGSGVITLALNLAGM
jgi:membrane-bound metal-dependent hydrolase YbcI (DUF457 family)